jgi:putative FmdB family regulatory protein
MPIYEYRCSHCGHTLEVMQKVSDPAPTPCPSCHVVEPLERLMSRTSFQLKGGGWYSDLYGSVKKEATPEGGSSGSAPAATGDAAAKPAAKPAPAPAAPAPASSGGTGNAGGSSPSGGSTT